ncbi:hypothetical protein Sjap_014759 [Stephania japonica]|uniref:Nicastrin n=1 Tax=Stephania japonica TaxID=461633 RepID=A0AAP0II66_9MAGN
MATKQHLWILLTFVSRILFAIAGQVNMLESVPDLESSMYLQMHGYPCVRLLNLSGEIGCANPSRDKVIAPVIRYKNADGPTHSSAILVDHWVRYNLMHSDWVLNDQEFAEKVTGVLVEPRVDGQTAAKGFSPVEKFPQVEFSPYQNTSYEWNPLGSGIMWNKYDFPVFLLSQDSAVIMQEIASKNEKRKKPYTMDVAEFDLVMQTTKSGTHDSESCLVERTCLPLGGYSVLSLFPPINASSSKLPLPIILVVASMDSASFFRDKSLGADSPLSGMISLLAAVDALSQVDDANTFKKQIIFLIVTGEAWGYLGSRRFLAELDMQTDIVNGIDINRIELVLEIGSVGKSISHGINSFFAHVTRDSPATNRSIDALKGALKSLGSDNIKISMASSSNPGIPPSSLMAFMKQNRPISGVVLEDFDTVFTNKFYHSNLDDLSNINSSVIAAAASLVSRALYILASDTELNTTALSSINVNSSLVEDLLGCLLTCEPGLSCELMKDYITPTSVCPNNYVGVLQGDPTSTPYPEYVSDVSRFVWNFLAEKTSLPSKNTNSSCSESCSNKDVVCIRAETPAKGTCVVSTTRYIPAYSTRLKFVSNQWILLPPNASDPLGIVDPVWTESFWNVIGFRTYTVQSATYDRLVLLAGIIVTVLAYLAIAVTRTVVAKALKHD